MFNRLIDFLEIFTIMKNFHFGLRNETNTFDLYEQINNFTGER